MDIHTLLTSHKGRISRSQYWFANVLVVAAVFINEFLAELLMTIVHNGAFSFVLMVVFALVSLVTLYCYLMLSIKRFHDMDKSGWFSLLALVPIVNLAVGLFWLGFIKGTDGANTYGADPLLLGNNVTAE